jgi:hypothetical protein
MMTSVILHNIITNQIQTLLETYRQIEDNATHTHLLDDLIEHHWQLHGQCYHVYSFDSPFIHMWFEQLFVFCTILYLFNNLDLNY